jgi:RNA polymerase sigma-70 factor (ECF subfamily)
VKTEGPTATEREPEQEPRGPAARGLAAGGRRRPPALPADLVERAQAGDERAFAELYRARVHEVARYAAALLRADALLEDVVAQTFLLAWRDLPRLRDARRFDPWLFRIAHNQAMSAHRRRKTLPLEAAPEPADPSPFSSPQAALDASAEARALSEALRRLPQPQRSVLILRFLHGWAHADVARALGKREEAVRALQYRALGRMRELLRQDLAADG